MPVSPPLTKDVLKKMFIKVLYEHTSEFGLYNHITSDYRDVLHETMVEFFNISHLTEDEFQEGIRAVRELECYGYIQTKLDADNDECKELTEKGKLIAVQNIEEMQLPNVDIDLVLTRYDLREEVLIDFLLGEYETAIKKAFFLIETKVRDNAVHPTVLLENENISNFFVTREGKIKEDKNSDMSKKLKTFHFKLLGDIMWYKTVSNRDDIEEKAMITAQILGFVNFHLKLVDHYAQLI